MFFFVLFQFRTTDDNNATIRLFGMAYNNAASLQSNFTLVFEGQSAFVASGVTSMSAIINGKKESVPVQYTQQLVEVSSDM